MAQLHLDIPSYRLAYSNKRQNPSKDFELKTCFLVYCKIKTYVVPNYLLLYKHNYVGLYFFNCVSITVYF